MADIESLQDEQIELPVLPVEDAGVEPVIEPAVVDRQHRGRWLALTAAGMAVSASLSALGSGGVAAEAPRHVPPPSVVRVEGHPLPPTNLNQCPAADPASIAAATHLINQPLNPDIARQQKLAGMQLVREEGGLLNVMLARSEGLQLPVPTNVRELSLEANFQVEKDAAAKGDLTVYDPTKYLLKMQELYRSPSTPFSTYLELTQEYMRQFGVTVRVGTDADKYSYDLRSPQDADLETMTAKWNLNSIIVAFSKMPREYIELDGLKTIILGAGKSSTAAAYAITSDPHNTIVLNMSDMLNPGTLDHENEHLEDDVQCGGPAAMANDPSYITYNLGSGETYTGQDTNSVPTMDGAYESKSVQQLEGQQFSEEQAGNLVAACRTQGRLATTLSKIALRTSYSAKNVMEDKAQEGDTIGDPNSWPEVTNPLFPRIRGKFTELLGRLWYYRPAIADYFAAIANRQQEPNPCSPSYKEEMAALQGSTK